MLDNDPDNNPDTNPDTNPDSSTNDTAADAPAETTPQDSSQSSDTLDAGAPETDTAGAAQKPAKKAAAKKAAKAPAKKAAAKKTTAKKTTKSAPRKKAAAKRVASEEGLVDTTVDAGDDTASASGSDDTTEAEGSATSAAPMVLFKAPEQAPERAAERAAERAKAPARKRTAKKAADQPAQPADKPADKAAAEPAGQDADKAAGEEPPSEDGAPGRGKRGQGQGKGQGKGQGQGQGRRGQGKAPDGDDQDSADDSDDDSRDDSGDDGDGEGGARRRRRRGGRRRRKPSDGEGGESDDQTDDQTDDSDDSSDSGDSDGDGDTTGSRRRRRRRRPGENGEGSGDQDNNTTTRVRRQRNPEDEITSIGGSTRLEAKKQRRREGREAGRRRAPIVSEAEFLARRESVDRVMVVRQKDDLTQIGVLEDKVLVEHYVARESQTSLIGNVYLGRVQNVLPSMEAAFIDIGKGRNAVLYAGEVNWAAVGHKDGQQRKIESVLSSGQTILVQVSKDPVGHKGARLTGQVSLPGRFLVYVPDGNTSGISRKLPDTERNRLKTLLKQIVPDTAGVIVRTAAEGASEEELTLDVERLTARWSDIEEKVKSGKSPQLLYGEPDLTLKVVRDLFTEDFAKLVVQGDDAWDLVDGYVSHVAPDLQDRLERFEPADNGPENKKDLFASYRVDEQIAKGLDRKVWLPSGGSLIIDRTEAMTVVDVNTGKFTGSGGNLEETVTKNNLEAAEEMVRQLRLRDIGGIIVIDFIDMVLESNRDLVLRRLVECLGRDRTRHQVAEVTSLGLVQMTRKRIGTGLLEAFSTECEHCKGRGLIVHEHPVESAARSDDDDSRGRGRGRGGRNRGRGTSENSGGGSNAAAASAKPSPADLAKSRPPEKQIEQDASGQDAPAANAAVELAEQAVIGSPTPAGHEPQHVPTQSTPSDEPPTPVETTHEPPTPGSTSEATPEAAPEPAPETAPEPPRVVTSTRRRTARRPAGPPSPLTQVAPRSGAGKEATPVAEPVDIPVEHAAAGHAPDPTSTEDPIAEPDPRADEVTESHEDDGSGNGFSLQHVPVKRKGSRKR